MAGLTDERREVAARLRDNANKHGVVLDYLGGAQVASWWLLLHTIGCNSNEQEVAFNMLADLIGPMCTIDVMDTGERADYECREHIMHCSHCNAEFGYVLYGEDGDVSMDDKPKFCPGCGSRDAAASKAKKEDKR